MKETLLKVKLKAKSATFYQIIIGEGLLNKAEELIKSCSDAKKFLIITDKNVYKHYKNSVNIDNAEFFIIESSEEAKNLETYSKILKKAQELKLERKDAFIALGGGIVGDITGFAAATYLRGVDFIQIPTTLLSQVDSSVGGKTGVNTDFGKNLIGAFYQPKLVIIDTKTLSTLDSRQFKTGMAEVIKYAFIEKTATGGKKPMFFKFLKDFKDKVQQKDPQTLQKMIEICCKLKADVVSKDEKEVGLRAILNFGHTFAHAIEKVTDYRTFTHGEALAIGLKMALYLSKDSISKKYLQDAINLIESYDLNYALPENISMKKLIEAMKSDKKVESEKIRFVTAKDGFEVEIRSDVERKSVEKVLKDFECK